MPYKARENADNWDLLAPDDSVVESGRAYPVDESDPDIWLRIVSHAQQNGFVGEAMATVATTIERV